MSSDTLRMIFDQYDPEGTGKLDAHSFRQFLEELGRTGISEDQFQRCFQLVNKDGSGLITKETFVEFVPYLYEVDFNPPVQREKGREREGEREKPPRKAARESKTEFDPKDPASFFVRTKKIGKGAFGQVFKAIDTRTNQIVALKIIDVEGNEDEIDAVQKEVVFQAQCKSPYIVEYYGSYLRGTDLWISMEYLGGGSCLDLMRGGLPTERQIRVILKQALLGLDYLHSTKKMHRDVKAGNLLVSSSGEIKLADFGVAAQIYQTMANKCTFAGTPLWMSPEVIQQKPQTPAVDIWSLGITAIELADGVPPKFDLHPMQVLFSVPDDPSPELEGEFSDDFKDFVRVCLIKDPKLRPTAAELLGHPFIQTTDTPDILLDMITRFEVFKGSHSKRTSSIAGEAENLPTPRVSKYWDFESNRSPEESEDGEEEEDEEEDNASQTETALAEKNRILATAVETQALAAPEAKAQISPEDLKSPLAVALQENGLLEVFPIMKENDVDYDSLLLLDEADLKDLQIKLGSRKKLMRMIRDLGRPKPFVPKGATPLVIEEGKSERSGSVLSNDASSGSLPLPSSASSLSLAADLKAMPDPDVNDVEKWTVNEVCVWMAKAGYHDYVAQFEKNLIDGEALLKIGTDSLKALGMDLVGIQLKFMGCIDKLKLQSAPSTPVAGLSPKSAAVGISNPQPPTPKRSGIFARVSFSKKKTASSSTSASANENKNLQEALSKTKAYQKSVGASVEVMVPAITADQLTDPEYAGWLTKQGGGRKNWKKRWFVLKDCVLYYFPSPKGTKAKGLITLPSYKIWVASEIKKKYAFKALHESARTYYFLANNFEEMKIWMKVLHEATVAANIPFDSRFASDTQDSISSSTGSVMSEDTEIDLAPRTKKAEDLSPNMQRFLDILSDVREDELEPFFEMAETNVEMAVKSFYMSKMK